MSAPSEKESCRMDSIAQLCQPASVLTFQQQIFLCRCQFSMIHLGIRLLRFSLYHIGISQFDSLAASLHWSGLHDHAVLAAIPIPLLQGIGFPPNAPLPDAHPTSQVFELPVPLVPSRSNECFRRRCLAVSAKPICRITRFPAPVFPNT